METEEKSLAYDGKIQRIKNYKSHQVRFRGDGTYCAVCGILASWCYIWACPQEVLVNERNPFENE